MQPRKALELLVLILAWCAPAWPEAPSGGPQMLPPGMSADRAALARGEFDEAFAPFDYREARKGGSEFWLKLDPSQPAAGANVTSGDALVARHGRHLDVNLYVRDAEALVPLSRAARLPAFAGVQESVFVLPARLQPGEPLFAHVAAQGKGAELLKFDRRSLEQVLGRGAAHSRMIAICFGALVSMALAALVIWFVLADRLFVLYAMLFFLQALYIAYLSGEGFEWPLLSWAAPLSSHAWNVPVALSGAAACLFVREIADLRRDWPRSYRAFGIFAVAFVVLAFANMARAFGLGGIVAMIGNLMFLTVAVFTVVVAGLAWRRGNRAAGWFLIAWFLLEIFTFAAALQLIFGRPSDAVLYYGLPLSMVAAAILVALGVADRLREQRVALSEAERHAQTDALTGVLNRRSLINRLEAACARARTRGLPISLLFIDLDHFKQINDTYGHLAGDACLAAIIAPIQSELRQSDVIGRYGGEEFVVILSSADATAAHLTAERVRARVADVRVEGYGSPIGVTCSIGVATSDSLGVWGERLIALADAAVYAAKRSGRNQVLVAQPSAA